MNMSPFRLPVEPAAASNLTNLMGNLAPIRYVGSHFCIDDTVISKIETSTILSSAQQSARVRCRFHSGTWSTRELDLCFTWFASI
jgi:hypothetical protein